MPPKVVSGKNRGQAVENKNKKKVGKRSVKKNAKKNEEKNEEENEIEFEIEIDNEYRGVHKVQDQFCWMCHRKNVNYHCSTCIRLYHIECINLPNGSTSTTEYDYSCKACIEFEIEKEKKDNPTVNVKKMLSFVATSLINNLQVRHRKFIYFFSI